MRVSRSRTISRRIRLLHEYGKLVSKKSAMNVFGASVFLASFLLGAQLCASHIYFSADRGGYPSFARNSYASLDFRKVGVLSSSAME
jgi:hypothetical protein